MKGLSDADYLDVQALFESQLIGLPGAMLEKDILVREAILALKDVGKEDDCRLIFCGGTALSQAHCVIERMSEDADFRIVVPQGTSRSHRRKLLVHIKEEVGNTLTSYGFPLEGEMRARNENSYIMGNFGYQGRFNTSDNSLRNHIKLEITAFDPVIATTNLPLRSIVDRVRGVTNQADTIEVVSIADTVADKIVGYLRRTSQDRAGFGRGAYDDRLVRHIYDVHSILTRFQTDIGFDEAAFNHDLDTLLPIVVERDRQSYGHQYLAFKDAPYAVLLNEVALLNNNSTQERYRQFCESMIWGAVPSLEDATNSFSVLASHLIPLPDMRPSNRASPVVE